MRAYARKYHEDEELWGLTGLLHDFDYEAYPTLTEHTVVGGNILREQGYPEALIHAIQAHNQGNGLGCQRESLLDKALFACDELAGFITAVALIRPSKSILDVKPKSVKKKFKEKAFAAAVKREDIFQGVAELGVEMDAHLQVMLEAMGSIAKELDLAGPS